MAKRARSMSRSRYAKRRRYPYKGVGAKVRRKRLVKMIKTVSLRQCETKFTERGGQNINLYHNGGSGPNFLQFDNMCRSDVGVSEVGRIGDEVFGVGVALRIWLSNKHDRPNVMHRIIIYRTAARYPDASIGSTDVADLLDDSGAGGNHMTSFVNTQRYKVIKDFIVQPPKGDYSLESGATTRESAKMIKLWIPTRGRIKYDTSASQYPKSERYSIHMAIIPYSHFGALTSDNVSSCAINARFYFKDP